MPTVAKENTPKDIKPANLKGPIRSRVKRYGKLLSRKLAVFLARQSLVPDEPVLPNKHFPYLQPIVDNWETICLEANEILKFRENIPAFQEISPDQYRIAKGGNWRSFVLFGFGEKLNQNCQHAPVTAKLLEDIPQLQTAWFSILAPRYHIPAHRGVTKGILRAHLGLIIPKNAANCRIRVDDKICVWHPGEIFVFDDTYEHEVWNDTDDERVILLFDFDRPMKLPGRLAHQFFLRLMKLTAFYQTPRKNLNSYEDRFAAAVKQADANKEAMSE